MKAIITLTLTLALILVSFAANPAQVFTFNMSYVNSYTDPLLAYEELHMISSLVGLLNRDAPTVYQFWTNADVTWFDHLRKSWLKDTKITELAFNDLLELVKNPSVVLWDPDVPASSNVAATISGVEGLIPICKRISATSPTLYQRIILSGPKWPVGMSIVGLFNGSVTGSKKCDAYSFALDKYGNLTNPKRLAYYVDYWAAQHMAPSAHYVNFQVTNHDYAVSKGAFFFDLSPWADVTPNDDPNQPLGTDLAIMKRILHATYMKMEGKSMIAVQGFTPWMWKYVDPDESSWSIHNHMTGHGGVETEWETAMIFSSYNAYLDADAPSIGGMAGASFFTHYPLANRYIQGPPPTITDLKSQNIIDDDGNIIPKTYISFYVGDYDSAAWLYSQFRHRFDDASRGRVALGWAVNPNLSDRFPVIFDYIYSEMRTDNDTLITGDSGAGYVNPTQLLPPRLSSLPSAKQAWIEHCIPYYRQFQLSFTGFLINGCSGMMTSDAEEMYISLGSWNGMVEQWGYSKDIHLSNGTSPVFMEMDISGSPQDAAKSIIAHYPGSGKMAFQVYRSVLQSADWHLRVTQSLKDVDIRVVGPLTLSYLYRHVTGGKNVDRVTYVTDTIPSSVTIDRDYPVNVTIRNDGWNSLDGIEIRSNPDLLVCSCDRIEAGDTGDCGGVLHAPASPTQIQMEYGAWRGDVDFRQTGNLPWVVDLDVE